MVTSVAPGSGGRDAARLDWRKESRRDVNSLTEYNCRMVSVRSEVCMAWLTRV